MHEATWYQVGPLTQGLVPITEIYYVFEMSTLKCLKLLFLMYEG
jgi:hypothetical protein